MWPNTCIDTHQTTIKRSKNDPIAKKSRSKIPIAPPVKDQALGDDPLVDLGGRVECKNHRTAPAPANEVADDVALEEVVEENDEEEEAGQEEVGRRHHRRGPEEVLGGGKILDGDRARHGFRRSGAVNSKID